MDEGVEIAAHQRGDGAAVGSAQRGRRRRGRSGRRSRRRGRRGRDNDCRSGRGDGGLHVLGLLRLGRISAGVLVQHAGGEQDDEHDEHRREEPDDRVQNTVIAPAVRSGHGRGRRRIVARRLLIGVMVIPRRLRTGHRARLLDGRRLLLGILRGRLGHRLAAAGAEGIKRGNVRSAFRASHGNTLLS